MYLLHEKNVFYINQYFGYSLISFCDFLTSKKYNINPTKINLLEEKDEKNIYDHLKDVMQLYYIEGVSYCRRYEKFLEQFNKDRNIKYKDYVKSKFKEAIISPNDVLSINDYRKKMNEKFDMECFVHLKDQLKHAKIYTNEEIYDLPFSLEGKQLAYKRVHYTLHIYENHIENVIKLPSKKTVCFLINGEYIHIEPDSMNVVGSNELKQPIYDGVDQNTTMLNVEKSFPKLFSQIKNRHIEDSFKLGLLELIH